MSIRHVVLLAAAMTWLVPSLAQTGANSSRDPKLMFKPAQGGEFVFNTGVLRGTLRAEGKSKGLSPIVHLPSGKRLDSSMGLFSHYRVFANQKRYGAGAWDWPSKATLQPDGSVRVGWTPSADRPFDMTAVYRWATPDTLDLETTVEAKSDLRGFESFLACYFTPDFTNSLVCAGQPDAVSGGPFLRADPSAGIWQTYPRDDSIVSLIQDGRWKLEPHPVDWVMMPRLAKPLCVRRSPTTGLQAAMMSPPSDCFAISTPYETEAHYSMYLSLFGRDLDRGKTMRARTRLMMGTGWKDGELLKAYEDYVGTTKGN